MDGYIITAGSEGAKPGEQRAVVLPRGERARGGWGRDLLQRAAFHIDISAGVDLGRGDVGMSQEVPNDHQGDVGLEQMHCLGMAKGVWRDLLGKMRTGRSGQGYVLLDDAPDARTSEALSVAICE